MKTFFERIVKRVFLFFNFEIRNKNLFKYSDYPFIILSKVLDASKIKLVIDGGASIGDTSQRLSLLFPNAVVHAFEPFPDFHQELQNKANLNAFFGAANVNPARNGSTGIGKIIDSISEINPTIFSAIDFAAFCFAFSVKRVIFVFKLKKFMLLLIHEKNYINILNLLALLYLLKKVN